jgi:hypothetical protein
MDSKDYEKCHYLLHIIDLHLDNLIKISCIHKMMRADNDSQKLHGARQQDA